jgi:hypothetical protein
MCNHTFRGLELLAQYGRSQLRFGAARAIPTLAAQVLLVCGQPCRCLCRGFSQITITRPCRRITLHLSQILLTLGWTFIELLSELTSGKREQA